MRRLVLAGLLAVGFALISASPAAAQGCGPSNPNCIVPTAPIGTSNNQAASTQFVQQNISSGTNLSASIDMAFGSTRGSILERGASGWGIVTPGTSGLPWVSNGAGADPAYQLLTNAGLANMAANSLKANTGASPATPTDFGVSTGTPQFLFNQWAVNTPGIDIAVGTNGSPITTSGPTMRLSRTENIATAICGNNQGDNECNSTLALYSVGTSATGMQASALFASAVGGGTHDVVAGSFVGRMLSTGSAAAAGSGLYIEGRRDTANGSAVGAEVRVTNNTNTAGVYNSSGFSQTTGLWLTAGPIPAQGSPSAVGVSLGSISGQTWTVGYAATATSVTGQTFRDDSSATTSVQLNGTHTTGVDLTGGTFSGNAFQSPGFHVDGIGDTFTLNPASGSPQVLLDPQAASQQALIIFRQTGAGKWFFGKDTNNTFIIFDNVGSNNFLVATGGAGLTISPKNAHTAWTGGVAPTLTAGCNGAGSSVSGSDTAGTVTGQTAAATTCTLTFGTAYGAAPNCGATGLSSPLTGAVTPATGTLVVNFASTANYKFTYWCPGA